ncbi:MAG: DUF3570 domain-containing protein [Gammaproteobacteria bacterium]|nr:DUF3570 domain-containing protein [Gammaproteobacteria bacterium]
MQLKRKKIAGLLSVATCSLLCTPAQADEGEWDVDSAILYYAEDDDRVQAIEPVINATKDLGDEESVSLKLVIDGLTGSSPTGAVPSTEVQTFIRPSGERSYKVAPNETPLDPSFKDTRVAYGMNWAKPYDRNNRRNYGFNVSKEYDFTSISANALWQHDANMKNTTWSYGFNLEFDQIEPTGDVPDPLTSMDKQMKGDSSDTRNVIDLLFGVTQVIDRTSLFQVNLSLSESDGYMTDPYKLVSVVDDDSGKPADQLFESRPDSRSRQGLYGKYRKTLANDDIFTASYRYMTDDWGVDSNTFDFTYRFKFGNGYYLQPHLRLYDQTAADFYTYFLLESDSPPKHASADYRLGEMDATTIGIKFGREVDRQHSWSVRLEQYEQTGESSPSEAVGQLRNQNLYPDVTATIVQFSYAFIL